MAKVLIVPKVQKVTGKYSPLFSGEQRAKIAQQYNAGEVIAVLAARNDCSVAKIRRILLELGVTMRARGPLEGKKNKIIKKKTVGDIVHSLKHAKSTEYLPQKVKPQKK